MSSSLLIRIDRVRNGWIIARASTGYELEQAVALKDRQRQDLFAVETPAALGTLLAKLAGQLDTLTPEAAEIEAGQGQAA